MRRRRPEKRIILKDPIYNDLTVAKFVNYIMKDGKKSIAEKMIEKENFKSSGKVVTKISLVKNYCPAEEYHQRYLEKR